jgi:diaminohydroxyphosphoribosylaminopyrimidine deaminase/5-amino-6-(5-phosphoribosylamino)uracil reductase
MSDEQHMKRALSLARRGLGAVEPNPMVGCVIVKGAKVIGEGYHKRFGGPHAEIEALNAVEAGGRAVKKKLRGLRGSTAYVTLEPCSHHGKTGPCADALIEAGVGRVVVGCVDPNPQVAGRGVRKLKRAGIAVDLCEDALRDAAVRTIEPFAKTITVGLPWVIGKWASTVDGAIATRTGDSKWISNEESRRWVHKLRGRVDAVLTGIGTVLADDPQLTARGVRAKRIARRVVVDPRLRLPLDGQLIATLDQAPLTIATAKGAASKPKAKRLRARGVEIIELPAVAKRGAKPGAKPTLNLKPLMRHLVKTHSATNVLLEGGPGVMGSMIHQNMVDELAVFIGPRLLGDAQHTPPVAWPGAAGEVLKIVSGKSLSLDQVKRIGGDVMLTYRV